ncbi:response regulator transcription factor [Diplocloster modestus]|uniref:Stage 0 sporulation protein A homolog n=1 Tax=Diplocloster modestus TaxID=2850322 RepID=A0ABS6K8C3_9FIRM|nr:response regulator transcription factor [Diplocloster modestus]MBU9726770.1 response regulator transcription factor [Diplocloster modestus]
MFRILMIDDEPWLLIARKSFLEGKGCRVETAQTSGDAIAHLVRDTYDLILLDVKMPDISGFGLCGEIKKLSQAPIVFLSSLTEEADQLQGFAVGGTDYIQKDCPHELFWAKLQARLAANQGAESIRVFPPLSLDFQRQRATIHGADLTLTQSEFALLTLLSSRPRDIWTVEELFRALWGSNGAVDAQIVQGHLSRMRRKIERAFPRHEFIETVWGKGYRFVPTEIADGR